MWRLSSLGGTRATTRLEKRDRQGFFHPKGEFQERPWCHSWEDCFLFFLDHDCNPFVAMVRIVASEHVLTLLVWYFCLRELFGREGM